MNQAYFQLSLDKQKNYSIPDTEFKVMMNSLIKYYYKEEYLINL